MSYKLADFGEAKAIERISFDEPHSPRGTKRYMSPELLNGLKRSKEGNTDDGNASFKENKPVFYEPYANDIYSLGVVFFQLKLLDDLKDYRGHDLKSLETEEYFSSKLKGDQDTLDDLICRMIAYNPRDRPSVYQVLEFIHNRERIRQLDATNLTNEAGEVNYSRGLIAAAVASSSIQPLLNKNLECI